MRPLILSLVCLTILSCNKSRTQFDIDQTYLAVIEENYIERAQNRINYLQLVGLFKLDTLDHSFGKDSSNVFVLDIEGLPLMIGTIQRNNTTLKFIVEKDIVIKTIDDEPVTDLTLSLDEYGSSIKLYHKDLNWQVITRSGEHYLRVWHENNPAIEAFKGFEPFELNSELIFEGQFSYYETAKSEIVKSEVDGKRSTNFIGKVSFTYNGTTHDLDVGENGFTMVSDETTGDETYGGGRYIYLDLPKESGSVRLDFNYLYNPPCSFSKFTTCLYPPRQNHLPFKILAGERIKSLGSEIITH